MNNKIVNVASTAGVTAFELPLMEGPVISDSGRVSVDEMPTASRLAALQEQAREEGFELGRQEGLAQAQQEITDHVTALTGIWDDLAQPFSDLSDDVIVGMSDLAIAIARQLIRRELKTSPDEIVAVVRETVQQLPQAKRDVKIYLHPEDRDLVQSALSIGERSDDWLLESDPTLTRGGCIVETDVSRIDASLEARTTAVINQMLGDERVSD